MKFKSIRTIKDRDSESHLIRDRLNNAKKLGIPMRLRLLRGNRALTLYQRLGLVVCKETVHYVYMTTS